MGMLISHKASMRENGKQNSTLQSFLCVLGLLHGCHAQPLACRPHLHQCSCGYHNVRTAPNVLTVFSVSFSMALTHVLVTPFNDYTPTLQQIMDIKAVLTVIHKHVYMLIIYMVVYYPPVISTYYF